MSQRTCATLVANYSAWSNDVEILALRHQIMVLERQLGKGKVRFTASDRAFLAALLHRLPLEVLCRLRLLVRPDTVLRWHTTPVTSTATDLTAHATNSCHWTTARAAGPHGCGPSRTGFRVAAEGRYAHPDDAQEGKPIMGTFVLVHGAWHGAWCWERVSEYLTARGHQVVTPELPSDAAGAGRAEYLASIEDGLESRSEVVLVAHSMSGLVAPLATGNPAVSSLVLLAALVPRPEVAWQANGLEPFPEPTRGLLARMKYDELGRSTLPPADATEIFYHDCTPADSADAVAQLRSDASMIYQQTCPALPERRVPTTYVSCRQDRAVDGEWNAAVARDVLGADVQELDAGHSPFWSMPQRLGGLLTELT
ncbi:alpha/beta fold hydrolase [Streptantibioticus ferralitis]|uniref:Alpha/beta hydrolase n=1 Tax=Streptantibioticus ferralitis TaxID=236510 RepID=A0ABT5ZBN7_9ACTN|nr:alpha/beta hydrolase [Streptantibioticus ferralitis]MDF2261093.1 alpha/beta hydrolase [Streptantibioticus ferralitis]